MRSIELFVCTGSDCRKAKGYDEIRALATSAPDVCLVECQGICHGPVAGVSRDGEPVRWYERVSGDRRRALERVVRTASGRKRLRAAEVRSRRGRMRRPQRTRRGNR